MKKRLLASFLLLMSSAISLLAQNSEPADSLVRLMSAQSVRMVQKEGENFREVIGPASFLHNGTYLLCDTAVWNVDTKLINAVGHVQIIQQETVLTSDKLDYLIDLNTAQFRGHVVQLSDKDHNTLRTCFLDYNTKDSVAIFDRGGSLKDKDGQVIESVKGTYDSKAKTFTFSDNVNMYADSIYIKTGSLAYHTDAGRADFSDDVDAWKDENMLSSGGGWYDKKNEIFMFDDDAHLMTATQEGWADTLYFYRKDMVINLHGNAQLTDTTRSVSAMAGDITYQDSLKKVTLEGAAALVVRMIEKKDSVETADTLYMGADRITLNTFKMFELSPEDTMASAQRCRDMSVDPVAEYRAQAAEKAAAELAKAKEEKMKREGQIPGRNLSGEGLDKPQVPPAEPVKENKPKEALSDSTVMGVESPADSLAVAHPDSTATEVGTLADSLAVVPLDSTTVRFIEAYGDVKLYKKDIQACCDSLLYNDLDSLARMYLSPSIWNESKRQYIADSIFMLVRGKGIEKANLLSNAFIMIEADQDIFDQVKSTEMMAYFDSTAALSRFDALGEANAVFHLKEDGKVSTANKVESRMLSTVFAGGELDRVYYYESPKNDAYPIVQLPQEFRKMKGFSWDPDRRPASGEDITTQVLKSPQRSTYTAHPRAGYEQTERFFPGYMKSVADTIAARRERARINDSLRVARASEKSLADVAEIVEVADSLAADSLAVESADTAAVRVAADSLASATATTPQLSEKERKAEERRKKREARDAELDRIDAERAAAKAEKEKEKQRKKALKFLEKRDRQEAKDEAKIQRYMRRYEKKINKKTIKP